MVEYELFLDQKENKYLNVTMSVMYKNKA